MVTLETIINSGRNRRGNNGLCDYFRNFANDIKSLRYGQGKQIDTL